MKNLTCRTYIFCFVKHLIFKLIHKFEKGERNYKVTRKTKSKAFLKWGISFNFETLWLRCNYDSYEFAKQRLMRVKNAT